MSNIIEKRGNLRVLTMRHKYYLCAKKKISAQFKNMRLLKCIICTLKSMFFCAPALLLTVHFKARNIEKK